MLTILAEHGKAEPPALNHEGGTGGSVWGLGG
jgi:hypothetical protein